MDTIETIIEQPKKKGGIQVGTTATTVESAKLDTQLKNVAKKLSKEFTGYNEGHRKKKPVFENIGSGCVPDGGLWLDESKRVVAAFEAKHQGNHGNAQERHAKNYSIASAHRSDTFRYITLMTGEGAMDGGVLDIYAKTMLQCEKLEHKLDYNKEVNVVYKWGQSFILSPSGFTDDEVETIMRKGLS